MKYMSIQPFLWEWIDLQIGCLMEVSIMFDIYTLMHFTLYDCIAQHYAQIN